MKILVVEDDVVTQKLVAAILDKAGHAAFVSPNGRHALETLQVNQFDILITDVIMPEVDGRTLISALRNYPRLVDLPVIIISAVIKASDVMDLLEHGATYFVPKPFGRKDLLEYVNLLQEEIKQRQGGK